MNHLCLLSIMTEHFEFERPTKDNVTLGDLLVGVDHMRGQPVLAPITNIDSGQVSVHYGNQGFSGAYSYSFDEAIILTKENPRYLIGKRAIIYATYQPPNTIQTKNVFI